MTTASNRSQKLPRHEITFGHLMSADHQTGLAHLVQLLPRRRAEATKRGQVVREMQCGGEQPLLPPVRVANLQSEVGGRLQRRVE